jgi:DNA-binding NarL/FixJ family response regulator
MIKIVIIDTMKQDREQISSMLFAQDGFEIAGSGKDGYDALKLSARFRPDSIIMDLGKNNSEGPKLVPLIKSKSPATAVIFLSRRDDNEYVIRALSAGARGYLTKGTDMNKLAASVRTVYSGGYSISPHIIRRTFGMLSELAGYKNIPPPPKGRRSVPANIKRTELQIMSFIAKGYSNKEIAETLRLTQGTVRNYLSSAMHKAGLQNRTQVAIYAITHGLTDPAKYAL